MRRFLAKHQLPEGGMDPRPALAELADAAHAVGLRAVETFYSTSTGSAFTLFEAPTEADVLETYARAGLSAPEVLPAERIHTYLLDEPRRQR
jgi:hypothetical protein